MPASGHQRRFDVGGMSAIAPIATKMLRRDERRKGPQPDIPPLLGTPWIKVTEPI
jgi:hypothetical protein